MGSAFRLRAHGALSPRAIDTAQVRRAFALFNDPNAGCQLFALPSKRRAHCRGNDLDGLVSAVEGMAGELHLYFVLNPLPVEYDKYAVNRDILRRRWLFIDIDPIKDETNGKDNPATETEHAATGEAAEILRDYLAQRGWPAPVMVDSGNGWYLLYRLDLDNSAWTTTQVKLFLRGAQTVIEGRGKIDLPVSDARRLVRIPGTWNCKGQESAERPYRQCRLVYVPESLEVVTAELLAVFDQKTPKPSTNGNGNSNGKESAFVLKAGTSQANAYAAKALDNECARVACARSPGQGGDGRNNALNTAAFNCGTLVGGGYLSRGLVEQRLREAAQCNGSYDDPGQGTRGVEATIKSGMEAGVACPRVIEDVRAKAQHQSATDDVPADDLIIVRASEITPRRVEWLWPKRIPLGKLTTFAGVGGLGKTFVLCDITARVTTGAEWPHSGGECAAPGQVIFISGEDEPDDTLVPRLIEMHANLDRVIFLKTEIQDRFSLRDLRTLDKAIEQAGSGVRFVAIDPPTAYLGGVDDHKNSELRGLLSPLKSWAARHRVAVVFNTHVTKPQGQKVEAMMRVMGGVAWVNAVRSAHMFARDPEDHDRRLFCGMKMNLGKEVKGLSYRIQSTSNDMARVEWIGEVDVTADEAINRERRKRRGVQATAWLAEMFATVEELPSDAIWREAKQTDLSRNALLEAKESMGVKAKQRHDPEGGRLWFWIWSKESQEAWRARQSKAPVMAEDEGEI